MQNAFTPPWAIILAGGDGTRLRLLTAQITGDPRPKQFCPMIDGETLLDRTRRRVDLLTRFDRQLVVVSRPHEPYYGYLEPELTPGRLVVQPRNAGTGPGILYPLLRLRHLAGDVPVAIFPSDHYVGEDAAFIFYVQGALGVIAARPDVVALLGIEAESPETEYGWIEAAEHPLPLDGDAAFPILRFWEKPSVRLAERLMQRGALWNSFVMVGRVDAFLRLIWSGAPELVIAFDAVRRGLGTPDEAETLERVYGEITPVNFSERVLVPAIRRLVTLRVKGVEWSDWGNPQRVLATVRRTGWRPAWLQKVELASAV